MIVSLPSYRRTSHDSTSYDGNATEALIAAQKVVERKLDRFLENGTYTETLRIHENGRAYPRGFPLTSVSAPANAKIDGIAVALASNIFDDILINWHDNRERNLSVTYIGGYEPEDVPEEIVRAICNIAKLYLEDSTLVSIPSGATSVSVGDVSFSSKLPLSAIVIPGSIATTLEIFRRREV